MNELEILRIVVRQIINTIDVDEATASLMTDYYPQITQFAEGSLITARTRVNWNGAVKRAAADLWDTRENDPGHAAALWADIDYRDGWRIIPETITAAQAFALDELGWWQDHVYRSTIAANVYTPDQYAAGWEQLT